MEKNWKAMTFSIKPKSHARLFMMHTADDQDTFDCIGDKVEDPIEKRHQTQAQYDQMLQQASGSGQGILKCQAAYEWVYSDPAVNMRVQDVHAASSYRTTSTPKDASSSSQNSSRKKTARKVPRRVAQRDTLTKMVVAKVEGDANETVVRKLSFDNP